MSDTLLERYAAQIDGVLSCYDRILLTGTLTGVCYSEGMAGWMRHRDQRLFDYPRLMEELREMIRENAERIAKEGVSRWLGERIVSLASVIRQFAS